MFKAKRKKWDNLTKQYITTDEWVVGYIVKEKTDYIIIEDLVYWIDGSEFSVEYFFYIDISTAEFLNKY